jgi:hypothetical protein
MLLYLFFRYGDIFFLDSAILDGVYVCDYEMMKDMLSNETFSARASPDDIGLPMLKEMTGGHGAHGIISSSGEVTYMDLG